MPVRSDAAKYFAGLVALLAVAAGATVWAYGKWEDQTTTSGGVDPATVSEPDDATDDIPPGQATVTGTASVVHIENATIDPLPPPVTVDTPERGGGAGATIVGVTVDGTDAAIEWDAGQPFQLEGEGGGLRLTGLVIDASLEGSTIALGTGSHGFVPGTYTLRMPVAVGTGGAAATPADTVTFAATEASTVAFRGNANTAFGFAPVAIHGTGKVDLKGGLTVTGPDGSRESVAGATLEQGSYTITVTRGPEGDYKIEATLDGQVTTT